MPEILIVDDHPAIREGVKRFLQDDIPGAVILEAESAAEALRHLLRRHVRLLILDLILPGRGGLEFLSELHRAYPKIPVLVFSAHSEDEYAARALRAGAAGYLNKLGGREEILLAVRKVLAGERYLSRAVAEKLAFESTLPRRTDTLSNREYEVLRGIAEGKSLTTIAEELSLSIKTVSAHKRRTMAKLNLPNDAALIRYALQYCLEALAADGSEHRSAGWPEPQS
jgi:DNA-binding NarL/FixJ family response regulator